MERLIKFVYQKFAFILGVLLGFVVCMNGFNPINHTISMILIGMMGIAVLMVITYVSYGDDDTFSVRFVSRFVRSDAMYAYGSILLYIGLSNSWLL